MHLGMGKIYPIHFLGGTNNSKSFCCCLAHKGSNGRTASIETLEMIHQHLASLLHHSLATGRRNVWPQIRLISELKKA
jgi:hypothetical protein